MSGKKLVIVESPTKARTIRKFLGKEYQVESCMGHVRDLPLSAKEIPEKYKKEKWANLGVNVEKNFEPVYCVPKSKSKIVKALKEKLKESDELILATDEDREGESISWHLVQVLKPKVPVKRMVFHEITKEAIQEAIQNFRNIDENLVKAQEARRILDRLVGYTISPLLWKKVAYGLSAGRVQSVAVRLIVEREEERLAFQKAKYWSLQGVLEKEKVTFEARLSSYKDQKIATGKDFDEKTGKLKEGKQQVLHLKEEDAKRLKQELEGQKWVVSSVEEKPISRKPAPPFITSTLQQEANRKLGMSAKETMQVAQKLYERGMITYMRTDSTFLSSQAQKAARQSIKSLYGEKYLPAEPRTYNKKKVKGAQEAHEAIRPAGTEFIHPSKSGLTGAQLKLYELIWRRTVASQMVNAELKQVQVKLQVGDAQFSASGQTVEFPGYLKAYVEGDETEALDKREIRLPQLKEGETVSCKELKSSEHETKPPARFTEASLVQLLEKAGVGRPSTYAAIISTILDRGYVKKVGNALAPTFTALVVTKLLKKYLSKYVEVDFTSAMEQALDDIAQGELDQIKYLKNIYLGKEGLKALVEAREKEIDPEESRTITLKGLEDLRIRIGRYGAYVCREEKGTEHCASLPESQLPGELTKDFAQKLIDQKMNGSDALGKDPKTGEPIYVLTGRYGPYVQRGDSEGEKVKPKRMAIPPQLDPEKISLDQALKLLELPKVLGTHPESGKEVKVGLGRFGPYVVCDGDYRSIPKSEDLFSVDLKRALELLAQPKKGRGRAKPLKELGAHPALGEEIQVLNGKYGPYVKCGKTNVSIPDNMDPEKLTKDQAIELLASKGVNKKKTTSSGRKKAKKKKKVARKKKKKIGATTAKKTSTKTKIIRRTAAGSTVRT